MHTISCVFFVVYGRGRRERELNWPVGNCCGLAREKFPTVVGVCVELAFSRRIGADSCAHFASAGVLQFVRTPALASAKSFCDFPTRRPAALSHMFPRRILWRWPFLLSHTHTFMVGRDRASFFDCDGVNPFR